MKIYNGIRYLALGSRSQFTGSSKNAITEIEKTWYPFTGWWKSGFLFPVMIKSYIPRKRITDEFGTYNPKIIEFVKDFVDVRLEYFDDCGQFVNDNKVNVFETREENIYDDSFYKVEDKEVNDDLSDDEKYNSKVNDISDDKDENDAMIREVKGVKPIDESLIIGTRTVRLYTSLLNCYSKQDGSYVGPVDDAYKKIRLGMVKFYKRDDSFNSACIGETENLSYFGFNHRGICEFKIGSKVTKGDIGYHANNIEDYIEDLKNFWDYDSISVEGDKMFCSKKDNSIEEMPAPDLELLKLNRGEWEAITLNDARVMAGEFARGLN